MPDILYNSMLLEPVDMVEVDLSAVVPSLDGQAIKTICSAVVADAAAKLDSPTKHLPLRPLIGY